MNNLKRVLSLGLTGAMLTGMMMVGASAANFVDADEITHTDAVNTMVALNVINGKEDGSHFDPNGSLTRAEMAKLAVFVLHGGKDPVLGTKVTPTFNDIKGTWAESYIEYCSSTGIIAGRGDGSFDPTGTLTGSQAAKMLLVAMGYNTDVFHFTGIDWEINTNVEANKAGLYKELDGIDASATISRDDAAQMVYNAIMANTMKETWGYNPSTGTVTNNYEPNGKPLFESKFDGDHGYAYITGVSYNKDKGEFTYTVEIDGTVFTDLTATDDKLDPTMHTKVISKNDYSNLFGQKVNVMYNKTSKAVYGVYAAESSVLASGTLGDIAPKSGASIAATDTSFKIDGTSYPVTAASAVKVLDYNSTVGTENDATAGKDATTLATLDLTGAYAKPYYNFDLVDNTGDGKADLIVVYPVSVEKVTYVGTASITAGGNSYAWDKDKECYTASSVNYDLPEVKKGDYIAVTHDVVTNTNRHAEVVETLEGKVTGQKTSTGEVMVDGTWYPTAGLSLTTNSTYTFQVVNGYLVAAAVKESASSDVLYVIGGTNGSVLHGADTKVMFADGTTAVVEVTKVDSTDKVAAISPAVGAGLYTYTKKSEGNYELKTVSGSELAGHDKYDANGTYYYVAAASNNAAKLADAAALGSATESYLIADDAVFFIASGAVGSEKYSVMTGAALKGYASKTLTAANLLIDVNAGLGTVKAGHLAVAAAFDVDSVYGYVLDDPYTTVEDGTDYQNYNVWTQDGKLTVKDDSRAAVAKGNIITLTTKSNGAVTSTILVHNSGTTVSVPVAITGYNAADNIITLHNGAGALVGDAGMKLGDKVQYFFVDTKAHTAVESGEIDLAERTAANDYTMNAYAIYTTPDDGATLTELKAIVYDVNNDLDGQGTAGFAVAPINAAAVTGTPANTDMTVASMTVTCSETKAVAGDTVTLTVKCGEDGKAITGTGITLTCDGVAVTVAAKAVIDDGDVVAEIVVPAKSTGDYQVTIADKV